MSIIGKIKDRAIQSSMTVLQSLKKMDEAKVKMLFVFEKEKFLSILTIGDIQRAIIKQVNLSDSVLSILETNNGVITEVGATNKESSDIFLVKYHLKLIGQLQYYVMTISEIIDLLNSKGILSQSITNGNMDITPSNDSLNWGFLTTKF